MRIELAYITPHRRRLKSSPAQALLDEYVARAARHTPCQAASYESESALLAYLEETARAPTPLVLLDSRGQAFTSEDLAGHLGSLRDGGCQQLVYAIGPADGWSTAAWNRAILRVAFGSITLPHELALVILAEQVYRSLSILAGHPYHSGH